MLFQRVKSLDKILETAEKKSLKRQLGAFQLTMLGIGAIIGTGIFVLTAEAGQKAGPAMMLAFVIAAVVCALAALAYSELASMVPVSGSAYTYTYAVMGEMLAWVVGWALVGQDEIEITGTPKIYASSEHGRRHFCGECGTGLFYTSEAIFPGQIDVQSATLDDPGLIPAQVQIQTAERPKSFIGFSKPIESPRSW